MSETEKKFRQDVIDHVTKIGKWEMQGVMRYVMLHFFKFINAKALNEKIMAEYQRFLKNKELTIADLDFKVSDKEIVYYAEMLRAAVNHLVKMLLKIKPIQADVRIEKATINGVRAEWECPQDAPKGKVILYMHGGGFISGSPCTLRPITARIAKENGAWVLSLDYRMAPEHPFPAGLDDCVAAYDWLLSNGFDSKSIVLGGDSAGATLVLTTLQRFKQLEKPMPAGAMCFSPEGDLSLPYPEFRKNARTDPILQIFPAPLCNRLYAKNEDFANPLVSPIKGNFHGLPPILVHCATHEMLHRDGVEIAKRAKDAGVDVTFREWEEMIHDFVGMGYGSAWPEIAEAHADINAFLKKVWE